MLKSLIKLIIGVFIILFIINTVIAINSRNFAEDSSLPYPLIVKDSKGEITASNCTSSLLLDIPFLGYSVGSTRIKNYLEYVKTNDYANREKVDFYCLSSDKYDSLISTKYTEYNIKTGESIYKERNIWDKLIF